MNKNKYTPESTPRQKVAAIAMLLAGLAILIIALVACTPQALTTEPTDLTGATPLRIGTLTIGNTPDAATRIAPNGGSFTTGDEIVVMATYYDTGITTATYTYTENNEWELAVGSSHIIVERIEAGTKPIVYSWGGKAVPPNGYNYADQSTEASYRYSDVMISDPTTTLNGRTLNAALEHTRVDIVVNIPDAPANATLTLKCGNSNIGFTDIETWKANKDATPDITTFRACVLLVDVPGFNGSGTVLPNSLLGTLTYTPDGSTEEKPLKIRYTIGSDTDVITSGMRITISVPFSDLVGIGDATATVSPWNDTHAGEVGTAVSTATGLKALDQSVFNADNPVWIITGDGATESDATTILFNVKVALNKVTTKGSIRLFLTGFKGKITNSAFTGSSGILASFSAPKATTIGIEAFSYYTDLSSVTLPAVHTIGNSAFAGCSALTRLELTQSTTLFTLGTNVFNGIDLANNTTLVLASNDPKVLNTIGVTVGTDGKTVTFLNGNGDDDNVTYEFKTVTYKDTTN